MSQFKLFGRVIIKAEIHALSGLHIGGSGAGLEIGGLDKEVIRNPINQRPYIPGSSLRGKMRSQSEKVLGLPQNNRIAQVKIHTCKTEEEYHKDGGCAVCHVFGVPAEIGYTGPTRLIVRDVMLTDKSASALEHAHSELLYSELKTEAAIDRVTSAASPRTIERVPAGAVFGPSELVFSLFDKEDFGRLKLVVDALQLVEDDYLGGSGSRGSGKVQFRNIVISARSSLDYAVENTYQAFPDLAALIGGYPQLLGWVKSTIPMG